MLSFAYSAYFLFKQNKQIKEILDFADGGLFDENYSAAYRRTSRVASS